MSLELFFTTIICVKVKKRAYDQYPNYSRTYSLLVFGYLVTDIEISVTHGQQHSFFIAVVLSWAILEIIRNIKCMPQVGLEPTPRDSRSVLYQDTTCFAPWNFDCFSSSRHWQVYIVVSLHGLSLQNAFISHTIHNTPLGCYICQKCEMPIGKENITNHFINIITKALSNFNSGN